ncbi:ABC transporter [Pseudohyphozyma bogoriensis]|nr:ABC transporter [Pseudohyphozyma bogoriensis]
MATLRLSSRATLHLRQPLASRTTLAPRYSSSTAATKPSIFKTNNTTIFPFGCPSNEPSLATFSSLSFEITDSSCWAILSSSSSTTKSHLVDAILARARFDPPSSASYPILKTLPWIERQKKDGGPREPTVEDVIQFVSFKTRLGGSGGGFDDYTARYYAIREEDKLTLKEHLKESMAVERGAVERENTDAVIEDMAKLLQVDHLLDLPLVTLSNGQTRRARILKALLKQPELVILEEPFTGLDVNSRQVLSNVLSSLHSSRSPRVLLILRPQDPLPSVVSHIALLGSEPREIDLGTKEEIMAGEKVKKLIAEGEAERAKRDEKRRAREEKAKAMEKGDVVMRLRGVNVSYNGGERKVLRNIDWEVREGERWILSGHNGSGKSTLLSLVLGDHPRSYTEDVWMFGKPRADQATATLQANIGHVSPEIFNSFPRKFGDVGLTAKESIVTGFESVFSYRKITPAQQAELDSLLDDLAHPLLTPTFLNKLFAELSPGEQSLILLLRALVKRPPLLVLDEPFAGMDKETIDIVKKFIDEKVRKNQAVILISHFEEELPESVGRRLALEKGEVVERV